MPFGLLFLMLRGHPNLRGDGRRNEGAFGNSPRYTEATAKPCDKSIASPRFIDIVSLAVLRSEYSQFASDDRTNHPLARLFWLDV